MPESHVISVWIGCPLAEVAAFLAEPSNMNRWAAGLGHSLRQENGAWRADGPGGTVSIRFSPRNAFGIADHWVTVPGKDGAPATEIYVPLRAIAHGAGCDVQITLQRLPAMSDDDFAADARLMRQDLETLKALLEKTP